MGNISLSSNFIAKEMANEIKENSPSRGHQLNKDQCLEAKSIDHWSDMQN